MLFIKTPYLLGVFYNKIRLSTNVDVINSKTEEKIVYEKLSVSLVGKHSGL